MNMRKNKRAKYLATALVTTLLISVGGCASHDDVPNAVKVEQKIAEARAEETELIKSTIADSVRLEQMLVLLEERDQLMHRYVKVLVKYSDELHALNADYATTREQFERRNSAYNGDREVLQREFVTLIDSMKKQTTTEEWKSIAKYQLKKLNPRDLAFEQALGGA